MLELLIVVVRALALALRGHRELVLENLALRQQLAALRRTTKRARLRTCDRLFWIAAWRECWQKLAHARWWSCNRTPSCGGIATGFAADGPDARQPRRTAVHRSISRSASSSARWRRRTRLWGAPRIHGELRTLGVDVSERTVSRLLERHPRPPSQTWRTFLTNHLASAASMDFFTVPTLTGRVLFVLVVLSHHRRRIVHFNVTEHPTAAWTAQQVVDAFPDDTAPRWLHRDRDSIYGDVFRRRVAGMGIAEVGLSAGESVAESVRGARDRVNPPRMSGPCDRARRAASAPRPDALSSAYYNDVSYCPTSLCA